MAQESRDADAAVTAQCPRFVLGWCLQTADWKDEEIRDPRHEASAQGLSVVQQFTDGELEKTLQDGACPDQIYAFETRKAAHASAQERHEQGVHYTPLAIVDAPLRLFYRL